MARICRWYLLVRYWLVNDRVMGVDMEDFKTITPEDHKHIMPAIYDAEQKLEELRIERNRWTRSYDNQATRVRRLKEIAKHQLGINN